MQKISGKSIIGFLFIGAMVLAGVLAFYMNESKSVRTQVLHKAGLELEQLLDENLKMTTQSGKELHWQDLKSGPIAFKGKQILFSVKFPPNELLLGPEIAARPELNNEDVLRLQVFNIIKEKFNDLKIMEIQIQAL